jgi:regulator of sirC expression with transglutaminase-like and TPR domain
MIAPLDFSDHERFLEYCRLPHDRIDLEEGAWLLARTRHPSIDIEEGRMEINLYSVELSRRMKANSGMLVWLNQINDYLFDELGFKGNKDHYYEPDNSYLNRVLERRTGIPITLSTIYLLVARRLRLPVVGIGMPGHFLCRAETDTGKLFIDPFNGGELLSRRSCEQKIRSSGHAVAAAWLEPRSDAEILTRMCANLYAIYKKQEHPTEARWHEQFLEALNGAP